MKHISMLSGGRDSTAMTLMLLEKGEPLDYIVFCDTLHEHAYMYEYIDKLDAFFQRKYGMKITILKPQKTLEDWAFGKISSGENKGKIRGVPMVSLPCYWRREAKEYPVSKWLKENGITEYTKYIGYTTTEQNRSYGIEQYNAVAPLVDWGMSEIDVHRYLKDNEMENKLYEHFSRTGCDMCPKQRLDDKYMIYKHYKETWEYMREIDEQTNKLRLENGETERSSWHDILSFTDMENLFKKRDRQATFEFEEEEVRDCFCKI